MKQSFKRIISFTLSICIVFVTVLLCPVSVYATNHGGGGGINHDRDAWIIKDSNTVNVEDDGKVMYWIEYILAQVGAIVRDHDITKAMANDQTMKSYISKGYYDANEDTVTFPQETVTYVYNIIQEKSIELNPFKIEKTYRLDAIPASTFQSKEAYNTFKTYCSSHEIVMANPQGSRFSLGDITPYIEEGGGFVKYSASVVVYNGNWKLQNIPVNMYTEKRNSDGSYTIEVQENYGSSQWIGHYDPNKTNFKQYGQQAFVVTRDGGRIRIFNSVAEFMDYNVGQRKVYFTKEYYNYTPADITASWDDIITRIDQMDDILQQLLDKITNDTDESTIEDLLRQILDELRNGGTGDGGGSDGGGSSAPSGWFDKILESLEKIFDMVDGYLRKILDQLKTILKKFSFSDISDADGTSSSWFDKVLDYLKDILDQLKSIKRWTVVDTVIDGVDAIADWVDLIHDILSDADDGIESAVTTLSDALDDATGLLKKKFPFSVPWDIFFFVTLLAAEPETPHFEVPIDFEISALDMHIHYDFIVDFSDYQYLSDIFRVILSMTYAVGLLKMTAGIVNTKKED